MIGAFNTVYSALQGFFSRGFWFAAFLPVAIFASVHVLIARQVYGAENVKPFGFELKFDEGAAEGAVSGTLIIASLVVIAFALLPLLPLFRGFVDGTLLPAFIHDALREARMDETRELQEKKTRAMSEAAVITDQFDDAHRKTGKLIAAYDAAKALRTADDKAALQTARKSLDILSKAIVSSAPLTSAAANAERDVIAALAANNPDPESLKQNRKPDVVPAEELEIAVATNAVADDFEGLLGNAKREAAFRVEMIPKRNRVDAALDAPQATRVAEARFIAENYPLDAYQVNFNFLWPRLLVAMQSEKADDPMLEAIDMARAKVDFAILCLVLAISIPLVWMPLLIINKGEPWVFLTIGVVMPAVAWFCYQLVYEGQFALAEVIKTAIDRSRFLVFKMLKLPVPTSRSEERELWSRLITVDQDSRMADLLYVRAAKEEATS